jgi:phenylpyruvate tautomerase PptA (4-oxalocrotonate tautomerase family)
MPIYHCISPEGLRDESQRENIAEEITRIHKAA